MRLKQNIVITETGFVFDSDTGDSYSTNPVGMELLEKLRAQMEMEEITAYMTGKYDVEPLQFQRYFDDFVIMLRHFNLMEEPE
ncbi:MAG: PqqD family protein [Bacteroidales bacterium]|nr:PqqD family protein [Bacteroidales bacterium]